MKLRLLSGLLLLLGALSVVAQDDAQTSVTVQVAESEQFGPYLTDADGRALYLFINEEAEGNMDQMMEGVRTNAQPCTGGCLDNWPPLTGSAEAGEGVNADLLYTAEFEGQEMVVYNGWPLYYFAGDAEAGQTNGQGLGSAPTIWYLVSPEGNPVEGGE